MALISISHVTAHYGGPILFRDITLDVERGQKIGVIGQNGTGKSTMLRMLAGMQEPQTGQVIRQRGIRVAFQAQELNTPPGATAWTEMESVFATDLARARKLAAMEHEMAAGNEGANSPKLLEEYGRLQHEHEVAGGYRVQQRIESVLSGLGLPRQSWHQPIDSFSGGERNVIGLARIILLDPDVMLLDEPSNHLDLDGVEWFIRFIRQTEAAVVMVSHNRHMLDACANHIWEVHHRKVDVWTGNYTDFVQQKEDALELQERQYKNQQRLIRRLEFQIRRLKDFAKAYDDPGQAKRAKAMEKRIETMDKVEKVNRSELRFHASLGGGGRHGRIALQVKDFSFSYPAADGVGPPRVIFDRANLEMEFGERVALVGPNGSGKSTLFKQLLTVAGWENETLRLGKSCHVGEYKQFHSEALEEGLSVIDWACFATGLLMQPASELMHRFLFTREDLDRPIATLSGGEKSRLQLARLVHQKVNFLLLDEPTNHLDIQACEQLEEMLQDFEGTLLVISHDRYFLDKLVNRVVEVADRKLQPFEGTFAEWWDARSSRAKEGRGQTLQLHAQRDADAAARADSLNDHERRKQQAREREQARRRLRTVEQRIAQLEEKKLALEGDMEGAYSSGESQEALRLTKLHAEMGRELDGAYKEWESLVALVDSAPASA